MTEDGKKEKEMGAERLVLFSDAVVAIAITLLALDLRLELPEGHHLTFEDLLEPWQKYVAFVLSFVMIADFWRTHHNFFRAIDWINEKLMLINLGWLFFIVTLPFSATLLSTHFGDTPAMFAYSLNIFMISVFQNFIWDYSAMKGFIDSEHVKSEQQKNIRVMLNLDMLNGLIAVIFSFFMPKLAFFLLFFKLPIIFFTMFFIGRRRRKEVIKARRR